METSVELLKLAVQIAIQGKDSAALATRLKLSVRSDLLTTALAIHQELRTALQAAETPEKPNTAT